MIFKMKYVIKLETAVTHLLFSSPGRSPGRALVLPPALAGVVALAKC